MKLKEGQILSNIEISRKFDVCAHRGIRYKGSIRKGIQYVVLVAAFQKSPEDFRLNPYDDKMTGNIILYTGEGRFGNQKMARGNLALKRQVEEKYPLYVFEKKSPGRYAFLGRYNVLNVRKDVQVDANGEEREVFIFELSKVRENRVTNAVVRGKYIRNLGMYSKSK
ncbi:MAG: hypothetical protein QXJ53_00365 [Candidatus Bathyarchaeia archaeon]